MGQRTFAEYEWRIQKNPDSLRKILFWKDGRKAYFAWVYQYSIGSFYFGKMGTVLIPCSPSFQAVENWQTAYFAWVYSSFQNKKYAFNRP